MKNRTIAIIGVGAYILSVFSTRESLDGVPLLSQTSIFLLGLPMAIFILMAIFRLWKIGSKILSLIATVVVIINIVFALYAPTVILNNIVRLSFVITYLWVVVRLYRTQMGGVAQVS